MDDKAEQRTIQRRAFPSGNSSDSRNSLTGNISTVCGCSSASLPTGPIELFDLQDVRMLLDEVVDLPE